MDEQRREIAKWSGATMPANLNICLRGGSAGEANVC